MKNRRYILLGLLMVLTAVLLSADNGENQGTEIVRATGTVRLVGSGTFPQLVITGTRVQWYIMEREDIDKLYNLQQRTVTVEGEQIVTELVFANGRPAGTRRELRNIRIISQE